VSYSLHRSAERDLTDAFRFYKAEAGAHLRANSGQTPGLSTFTAPARNRAALSKSCNVAIGQA